MEEKKGERRKAKEKENMYQARCDISRAAHRCFFLIATVTLSKDSRLGYNYNFIFLALGSSLFLCLAISFTRLQQFHDD